MIHLIHTLGVCGGTLLSRCIGVLPNVVLLSEVNPGAVKLFLQFDPLFQDKNWLGLLTPTDTERFAELDLGKSDNFSELLGVLHARAAERNKYLVVRDYSYIDFVGIPHVSDPRRRLSICAALPQTVSVSSIALIRHPIDQWRSLCTHEHVRAVLTPSFFCDAYAAFLRESETTSVHKYEDFVQNPEAKLQAICETLNIPFEPSFKEQFYNLGHVTGNFSRHAERSISLPKRKALPPEVIDEFHSSRSFRYILRAAGYAEAGDTLV